MTWGSWMPHKFKIAVSGCPRNCAEATIKDFGVVCVDSGYELHVGGNGGIKVRVTDLLVQGRDRGGGAGIIAAPSSSSTARRRATSSAPRLDRAGRPRARPKAAWSTIAPSRQRAVRPLRYSQQFCRTTPGRARARRGATATSSAVAALMAEMDAGMTRLARHRRARRHPAPRRARGAHRRAATSRCSAPGTTRSSRWSTAARTRAARCARASSTAARSPARCTTGSSTRDRRGRGARTRAARRRVPVQAGGRRSSWLARPPGAAA